MPITECGDPNAAQQIEVVDSVVVAKIDSLTAHKKIGIPLIRIEQQLVLRSLNRCQIHATMTSVPSLTRVEQRSGSSAADSAGRMRTRLTPCSKASRHAFSL